MQSMPLCYAVKWTQPLWLMDTARGIVVCGYYRPYGKWRNGQGTSDAPYDLYSGKILDLKEGKSGAVNYFCLLLDGEICPGVAIAVVPSHSPDSQGGGLKALAKKLTEHDRIDMMDCLIRTKEIEKLSHGGNRDTSVHLDSIAVNPDVPVADEVVDDVTTSGNSLYACRDILLAHGAKGGCFACAWKDNELRECGGMDMSVAVLEQYPIKKYDARELYAGQAAVKGAPDYLYYRGIFLS